MTVADPALEETQTLILCQLIMRVLAINRNSTHKVSDVLRLLFDNFLDSDAYLTASNSNVRNLMANLHCMAKATKSEDPVVAADQCESALREAFKFQNKLFMLQR